MTITRFLTRNVAPGSTIYTDGLKGLAGLPQAGVDHVQRTQPSRTDPHRGAKSVVPLGARAIGNLQEWLIGTHHGVSRAQLQACLDEFVFRHNRRRTPMAGFQTLLGLGTGRAPTPSRRIRGAKDLQQLVPDGYGGMLKQPDKHEVAAGACYWVRYWFLLRYSSLLRSAWTTSCSVQRSRNTRSL